MQHGALVEGLSRGGAAERAGLRTGSEMLEVAGKSYARDGDVIVAVGTTPVAGFRDLDRAIGAHRAGDRVDLHVVRSGKGHVVSVRLLAAPAGSASCA